MTTLSEPPVLADGAPENPCVGCAYFDGIERQYSAETNPTIARHLVRWRQQHADDGECDTPEAGPDE
ncbi:hypothetical protein ACFV4P_17495 [Kitasatospora sp. NPDC059795]|uniref:hypothetical protein n=1 Tax=Kitasatospora sp. NPDC059795 TaxID=3346949 RepID=UPI003666AF71